MLRSFEDLRKAPNAADMVQREAVCLVRATLGDIKHKNKRKLTTHVAPKDLANFQKRYTQCIKDKTYALIGRSVSCGLGTVTGRGQGSQCFYETRNKSRGSHVCRAGE